MGRKVYTNAFAGGEVSPLMLGHIEDEGYRTGFARGRNMLVMPTGAAQKRPQFDFVRAVKPGATHIRMFPFVYGDGDSYAMEWGPTHVRFHAEGTTLLYATPIPVASVDLSADTFTTGAPHGLAVNDAVRITHKGTSIPGSLLTGNTYYVRTVVSTTVFTLSASAGPGALLDLTTNSAIDETSFWRQSELPREYITSKNVSSVNAGANTVHVAAHSLVAGDAVHFTASLTVTADATTDKFTSTAHGLASGDPLVFSSTGTLPGNINPGVTYYVLTVFTADTFNVTATSGSFVVRDITSNGSPTITATLQSIFESDPDVQIGVAYYVNPTSVDDFTLHLTKAEALAGTDAIDITAIGGDTPKCHFAYYRGDIVWGGQLTLLGTTSARAFWCATDLTTALPTVSDWLQMPADGVYELLHNYGSPALSELEYDQSLDDWTFCSSLRAASTLSREVASFPSGTSATVDVVKFVFRLVDPSPGPLAPTLSPSTRVFGEYYSISVPASSSTFSTGGTTNHGLIPGDVVYVEGSLGSATAMSGVAGSPGFFFITTVSANTFKMRTISGGAEVQNSIASGENGFLYVISSSSRTSENYVVTALKDGDESFVSNDITQTNSLDVGGSSSRLTWTAVDGAQRYRLYKLIDQAYGLIVETDQLFATDDGIPPDLSIRPPTFDDSLQTEFPRAVASFQQRQWFGGSDTHPRRIWASRTGTVSTMSYHTSALLDTDRIQFDVAARERTLVRHIVPALQLWVMTSAAEIKITGQNTDIISPVAGIDARPISQIGCTGVRPIIVNSNILFVSARNGHVYELPSKTMQDVDPPDLSIRSAHLFDGVLLAQSAQQHSPIQIEWFVRDDGSLLGFTYMPEQNIRGWHLHTAAGTDAKIESVCVIPDSDGQHLYASIARTIDGSTVRHVERMGRVAQPATLSACKYLDSCVTYSGTPTTVIPVPHLPGEVVYAVADGRKKGPFTVANGVITLDVAASTVHVGLQFGASLRSLPPSMLIDGFGKGVQVNVAEVTLRVDNSCGFDVAVYSDDGIARKAWPATGIGETALSSKDVPVPVEGSYGRNGQIDISQSSPFPLTIVSMTLNVDTGGP